MRRWLVQAMRQLRQGKSAKWLTAGEPYCPYGDEFGLTIIPNYAKLDEVAALHKAVEYVYTQRSDAMVQSDGRLQLPPLPQACFMPLVARMEQDGVVPAGWLNNQTANYYETGDFIRAHVDNLFVYDDIFAIVSLGANALLRFVHVQNGEELDVLVPDRALYILSGPARYVYFHMVLPVEAPRISLVLRRSIAPSEGGFRHVQTPLGHLMPYRATQLLHTLYSRQIGGVRVTLDDDFLERNHIGAFDTAQWVRRLRPLSDWTLTRQLDEDAARVRELCEQGFVDVDLDWRVRELRTYYAAVEAALMDTTTTTTTAATGAATDKPTP